MGDLNDGQATKVLDQVFSGVAANSKKATIPPVQTPPEVWGQTYTTILPQDNQTKILMAQPGISHLHPDFFALIILNQTLGGGGGFSSRLYTEVREKRGLTYGIYSRPNSLDQMQTIEVRVATRNDGVSEVVNVTQKEWQKMRDHGLTDQDFQLVKGYLTGSYVMRFTTVDQVAGYLLSLQKSGRDMEYVTERNQRLDKVTLKDVNRVARDVFKPEQLTIFRAGHPTP